MVENHDGWVRCWCVHDVLIGSVGGRVSGWEGAELSPSTCPLPNFWPDLPPMGERREPNAGGQHAGKGGGAEALARYKMYEFQ